MCSSTTLARLGAEGIYGPSWLNEGTAEFVSHRFTIASVYGDESLDGYERWRVENALEIDTALRSLEDSEAFYDAGESAYSLGYLAVTLLVDHVGVPLWDLGVFYSALGPHTTWQDTFQEVFGLPVEAFYQWFEAFLEAHRQERLAGG